MTHHPLSLSVCPCYNLPIMTIQEQDALIGRIVREHAVAQKEYDLLLSKAIRSSDSLHKLSSMLRQSPEKVTIDGEPLISTISRVDFNSKEINLDVIKEMCGRIRELKETISRLEEEKKKFI